MDALSIRRPVLAGYDWGSRTADIIAALWPERVKALVSVSGYLITNLEANRTPLPPAAENAWWYQYYFATERGVKGHYESIVIGNYRWRQSLLPVEPEYAALEGKLQNTPTISVPTITIDGKYDPFTPDGNGSSYRAHFTGSYRHRTFDAGHNVPQEAPGDFAQAVVDADRL